MAADNAEEPHMGASHDKLPNSSAASLDACSVTRNSTSKAGKLEYFKGVPEVSTFPSSLNWETQPHVNVHTY